jgi:3-methylcrotonyl-CoA carboxylase alpha subunit
MFHTLLIANRGEIACRVAATARRLGIRTVAVYSDADANSRHVAACDEAVHIGGPAPRDSYLRAERILQAARDTGAQAVHPGYGFLSENEGFAQACADAGITFVGPPASAIAAMGSKSAAKTLMEKAGVPLVPGYHGDNQDPAFLREQADKIGYPVLIKASAGGGGKGMRIVEASADFEAALASCKREAASSFGDDRVLIERYLKKPRHIEIQVFADTHGNVVYLFERDCSVQRRHQKVIEEAPAPGMTEERRRSMGEAAVAAARAVGYVGAGTVEFIAEPDGRFYFMEMNTRLQVEHPVTEMITGFDLVEWQLRVAAGETLPTTQESLRIHGHAIEARVYAENPDTGFLPSIGTLSHLSLPPHVAFQRSSGGQTGDEPAPVRIDGSVRQGDTITPHYDPMIAKLIVWGADRDQARARMVQALAQTRVVGVQTNVAFLARLMQDTAFAAADLDTGLIERQRETLLPTPKPVADTVLALAVAAVLAREAAPAAVDPWAIPDNWRSGGVGTRYFQFDDHGTVRHVSLLSRRSGLALDLGQGEQAFTWSTADSALRVQVGDVRAAGTVVEQPEAEQDRMTVFVGTAAHLLILQDPLAVASHVEAEGGRLTAPMPGKVIAVSVKEGDVVEQGQPLLVMEAMKMEHTIGAPSAGTVREVFYSVGEQVQEGAQLIALEV